MRHSLAILAMLGLGALANADDKGPDLSPQERQVLEEKLKECQRQGAQAFQAGDLAKAFDAEREAYGIRRKLLGGGDHAELAASLNNLGFLMDAMGSPPKALPYFQQALEMKKRLFENKDNLDMVIALNNVGHVYRRLNELDKALLHSRQALEMCRRVFKDRDHVQLTHCLSNYGSLLQEMGENDKALAHYQEALEVGKRLHHGQDHSDLARVLNNIGSLFEESGEPFKALSYCRLTLEMTQRLTKGRDHESLATATNNMGYMLKVLGEPEKALGHFRQALDMHKRLSQGRDHPALVVNLYDIGAILNMLGEPEKALPYCRQALEMSQRIFPGRDHPLVARSLNGMGYLLQTLGQLEKALPISQRALEMYERNVVGKDDPRLAGMRNNMGILHQSLGQPAQALEYYLQALEVRQRLYKNRDHADLAMSFNNVGALHAELGEYEKALSNCRRGLEMTQRLYKDQDHPRVTIALNGISEAFSKSGQYDSALPMVQQSLAMTKRLNRRYAESAPLAEALAFTTTMGDTQSMLLSVSQRVAKRDDDAIYSQLWTTKASLARLLQQRHQLARLEKHQSKEVREKIAELHAKRSQLIGLILQPVSEKRDRQLQQWTQQKEELERQLAGLLPQQKDFIDPKSAQLAATLQDHQAFIDLYRFDDRAAPKTKRSDCYVAFVLTNSSKAKRVELGPAEPIETALRDWRAQVHKEDARLTAEARSKIEQLAQSLRKLIWAPIAAQLPKKVNQVYLSPDADLARLPFAALPGDRPDTILLEQFAFATVPSGLFLFERIKEARPIVENPASLLVMGGIQYDPADAKNNEPWPFLEGSRREFEQVRNLWPGPNEPIGLTGAGATTEALTTALPKVRFAHIATHGFFDAELFAEERARLRLARSEHARLLVESINVASKNKTRDLSITAGAGVRNPVGYVGLVLAGANQPAKDRSDVGIASGLAIMDLDLSRMELAVLSACETGLGQFTEGKGIENLQLAFHVAGCENVIASLWSVNDATTAALMAKFYHEMWVNKKPPLAALREAQLTIYRHPERIPALAGERGKPDQAKTVELKLELDANAKRKQTTPTKLWAAFVLSGVGM